MHFTYHDGPVALDGYLVTDAPLERRPVVLVAHAWAGQDDFARGKAEALAQLGYVGLAIDMYGEGRRGANPAENAALMQPFMDDRRLLRRRIHAAVHAAAQRPECDGERIAAIGFCFGGLCALDLARSALPGVRGVVSFHGLLSPPAVGEQERMWAKVLVVHGHEDPMAPPDHVLALATELTEAEADWQVHIHGHAMHAFTNPMANAPESGLRHDPAADRRSWTAMAAFLQECFEVR